MPEPNTALRQRLLPAVVFALALAGCAIAPLGPPAAAGRPWPPGSSATPGGRPLAPDVPQAFPAPMIALPGAAPAAGRNAMAREVPAAPRTAATWRIAHVRGRASASSGPAIAAVDGDPKTEWNPRAFIGPGSPQWLALPLDGPVDEEIAVSWHGHALHYVNYDSGRPRTYEIQVSADSTDGLDGTWRTASRVEDNQVRSRVDVVRAPGARWVKLVFLTKWSGVEREPFLREVMVHERTGAGAPDAWLVMGDSTTSVGMDPAEPDTFAATVAARWPGHHPVVMSGGTGGDTSAEAVARLRVGLPTLPPGTVVGLCYGSNDARRGVDLQACRRGLQAAVDLIRGAGHVPVVATLPWSLNGQIEDYARICQEVGRANQLPPGPDFHAYFRAHPEELAADRVHPNAKGIASMQRLWAEAGAFRYD